ncbi:hypothetical protein [Clostridium botulinum]|nr:hypothetical protein [Clostridium botulinum]MBD5583080.1 hypothetical protein [Clostridium botulinum]MBD5608947.1 hypothetical protein [Clostridium botulinum]MBO3446883.1 hypothetical protein [Clostridium botulinum]MBY6869220.1 hypothetical protein [Clostridium botulinum]MBY6959197.1 hypothetical protein [Clostridium botulinum]
MLRDRKNIFKEFDVEFFTQMMEKVKAISLVEVEFVLKSRIVVKGTLQIVLRVKGFAIEFSDWCVLGL